MQLLMLKRRAQFQNMKSGASFVGRNFVLQAKKRSEEEVGDRYAPPRFGITVTKHTVRSRRSTNLRSNGSPMQRGPISVMRNRIRRRLRAVLRQVAPSLALENTDYVIIGRPPALTVSYANLTKEAEKGFQNVNRKLIPSKAKN